MILQVSYKSSSIISTANHSISSAFPFVKHANPFTIYLRIIGLSINQHTVQLTIVQKKYQLPNHDIASLLHVKQNYIYCKYTIRSAFPLEQHANPFTIYLRITGLSINQHIVQLTIIHRNINSKP